LRYTDCDWPAKLSAKDGVATIRFLRYTDWDWPAKLSAKDGVATIRF
jgi:hypothetical protein